MGGGAKMRRKLRLRNREDFSRVYRAGRSFANGQFVVYWSKQPTVEPFRCGISASKKIGNAVVRNHMRRRVKEIVRHFEPIIVANIDFVIIVRKPAVSMSYKQLEGSIRHVLKKAGVLKTQQKSYIKKTPINKAD